ncbi:hypothetical protein T09_7572 [Trichinella sp. T9]|nr:hypothetical protein T09_7572 [Trichinella sp. T9]
MARKLKNVENETQTLRTWSMAIKQTNKEYEKLTL